jgi:hypothetical protein
MFYVGAAYTVLELGVVDGVRELAVPGLQQPFRDE